MKTCTPSVRTALFAGALLAALTACQKKEGPAEQVGKQIDQAVEKAGDEVQDATRRDKK